LGALGHYRGTGHGPLSVVGDKYRPEILVKEIERNISHNNVFIENTIEELAGLMDVPADTLVKNSRAL
jgi:hypothetical protein